MTERHRMTMQEAFDRLSLVEKTSEHGYLIRSLIDLIPESAYVYGTDARKQQIVAHLNVFPQQGIMIQSQREALAEELKQAGYAGDADRLAIQLIESMQTDARSVDRPKRSQARTYDTMAAPGDWDGRG